MKRWKSLTIPVALAFLGSLVPLAGRTLPARAATGDVLADFIPSGTTGNGRGIAFDGKSLWYTVVGDSHIYNVTTTGAVIGSVAVAGGVASGGPLGWDGSALWTADYSVTSKIWRVDAGTGAIMSSCDFVTANPGDPAVTTAGKGIGYYPDGLDWSTTASAVWLSGEGGINAGNWVAELDPTTCKDMAHFVGPPEGADGTSGLAFVADPFNGDRLWQAHPQSSDIFQTDTSGVVTKPPFPAAHQTEDLAFDDVTFAPKCAVWGNEATFTGNHLTAYEVPCPERAIKASGTTISATEGAVFSGPVATFTDPDTSSMATDYTATIDWGDGTSSSGTISGSGGKFTVSGTHTYADEGTYKVTVTIRDVDTPTNTATAISTANVADAALTSACAMPTTISPAYAGPTATFTDANTSATSADFTATINWGDGTTTTGTVVGAAGSFTVNGAHTYTTAGPFTVTTTIKDDGGSTTTATCGTNVPACDENGHENDGHGNIKDDNSDKHTGDNRDVQFNSDQDDDNSQACIERDQEEDGENGDHDKDQKEIDSHDNRDGSDFKSTSIDSITLSQLGKQVTIIGSGVHNGSVVHFVVVEIDNGPSLPGYFSLQLDDGYNVAGSLIDGAVNLG